MFIDIHVHTVALPGPPRPNGGTFALPEQLIQQYDELGIDAGVLLPVVSPEAQLQLQTNEEILEICARYPGRFIPFCNVDARAVTNSATAPLGDLLRYYRDHGAKGIGEVMTNIPFLDPLVQNLFHHVEAVGFPLLFHIAPQIGGTYGLYDEPGMPQLEASLQRFPQLIFLGHSQPFWAEIAKLQDPKDRYAYPKYPVEEEGALLGLLRRYPNLHGDLSAGSGHNALARDPDYAVRFLDEFQDRLYFGTDICTPFQNAPLPGFLLDLRERGLLSETAFQKIAHANAERLLGLN